MLAEELVDGFHEVDEDQEVKENEEERIELPDDFYTEFVEDVRELACFYMREYFQTKEMYCGGSIPEKLLFSDDNITRVLNLDISNAVIRAYELLTECEWVLSKKNEESLVSDDILLVHSTLNDIANHGIPKELAGGMMLIYLEFVEGVEA